MHFKERINLLTPPKIVSWNVLFIVLGLIVVLNVILAITVALRIDRVVLVPGTTDVYVSVPYTLGDYLLFASLAITLVAFLITILMMIFKSFVDLLYALAVSLTAGIAKAFNIGTLMRKQIPKRDAGDARRDSHSGEASV